MIASTMLLRRALAADAAASGAMGLAMSLAAQPLAGWFQLPEPLLRDAGMFLLPYAALVGWMASRRTLPRACVLLVIVGNAAWTLGSLILLGAQAVSPTLLGMIFVAAQAIAVGVFAEMQFIGLRRSAVAAAA